ncbi:hypothetical protein ACFL1X_00580 [Candidatus Hydrogenedentota bacterium]
MQKDAVSICFSYFLRFSLLSLGRKGGEREKIAQKDGRVALEISEHNLPDLAPSEEFRRRDLFGNLQE